jgi:hypothetical protein
VKSSPLVVEGDVELVAEAVAEELHVFAIGVHAANEAAGGELAAGVAVRVPQAREDVVFVPNFRGAAGAEFLGQIGVVAAIEVDAFAIGADDHAVQAVLTAAFHGDELGDLVVLVVAIGVLEAVEAVLLAVFVHHDVKAVEGGEQSVGLAEFDSELFGVQRCRANAHAVDAAVLVTGDEAAFRIDGEGDPGAFGVFGNVVEFFDLEALRHGDVRCGDGLGWATVFAAATTDLAVKRLAPGAFAVVFDDEGFFKVLRAGFGGFPGAICLDDDVLDGRRAVSA